MLDEFRRAIVLSALRNVVRVDQNVRVEEALFWHAISVRATRRGSEEASSAGSFPDEAALQPAFGPVHSSFAAAPIVAVVRLTWH